MKVLEADMRRLSVVVTGKAQGDAVIAHVKATMPDERPGFSATRRGAPE